MRHASLVWMLVWGCCGILLSGCAGFASGSTRPLPQLPGNAPVSLSSIAVNSGRTGLGSNGETVVQLSDQADRQGYPTAAVAYQTPVRPLEPAPRIYQSSPRVTSPDGVPMGGEGLYQQMEIDPYRRMGVGPIRRMGIDPYRAMDEETYRQSGAGPNRPMSEATYRQSGADSYQRTGPNPNRPRGAGRYRQEAVPAPVYRGNAGGNPGQAMVANGPVATQRPISAMPRPMNGIGLNGSGFGRRGQTATEWALQLKYDNGILQDDNDQLRQRISELGKDVATQTGALAQSEKVLAKSVQANGDLRKMIAELRVTIQDLEKEKIEIESHADRALKEIEDTLNTLIMDKISEGGDGNSPSHRR